jgi:hypothetical protein
MGVISATIRSAEKRAPTIVEAYSRGPDGGLPRRSSEHVFMRSSFRRARSQVAPSATWSRPILRFEGGK